MLTERKEVMWCVDCGARFAQEEIQGRGCPKCDSQGVPCGVEQDVAVEINWHELRILVIWAENWAQHCKRQGAEGVNMTMTVAAIARRLQVQHPAFTSLTLSGEIATLRADLAKKGIEIGKIETNIAKPQLFEVNGPGAVGHVRREFSLAGTGFTLKDCGCREGTCEHLTDGSCHDNHNI